METAELLLNDSCLIQGLHPDIAECRDLDVFKLKAWCAHPELIPRKMDLHVVEPMVIALEEPAVTRTLIYPVSISVSVASQSQLQQSPPPSPPAHSEEDSDHDLSKRRRRR